MKKGTRQHPLDSQHDEDRLKPDRSGTETACNSAFAHDITRATLRAPKVCFSYHLIIATAFLDRLLHHSVVINMRSNSYRLRL